MNCELYCNRWFHIKCVNIVKSDYDKMQSLGNHNKWFCISCEKTFNQRKDGKMCCDCFSYISILTDSVKELSENHKGMSHNLNLVMMEQKNMRKYIKEDDATGASEMEYNQLRPSIEDSEGNKDRDGDRFCTSGSQEEKEECKNVYSDGSDVEHDEAEAAYCAPSEVKLSKQVYNNNGSNLPRREVNYRNSLAKRGQPNSRVSSNNQVRSSSFYNDKTNKPTLNEVNNSSWQVVNRGGRRGKYNRPISRGNVRGRPPRPNLTRSSYGKPSINDGDHTMTQENPVDNVNNSQISDQSTKGSYSQVLQSRARSKVIYGSSGAKENIPLKAAKRMFWLFLSGLDPSACTDEIVKYLKDLNDSADYLCEKLNSRYNTYSSFKIGVPVELVDELMHPNLWPQGCIVGKYRAPRYAPDRTRPMISGSASEEFEGGSKTFLTQGNSVPQNP